MLQIATLKSKKAMAALLTSCFHTGLVALKVVSVLAVLMTALCVWSVFECVRCVTQRIRFAVFELAVGLFMILSVLLQLLWVMFFGYTGLLVLGAFPGASMLAIVCALTLALVTAVTANYHERRMHRHRIAEWL